MDSACLRTSSRVSSAILETKTNREWPSARGKFSFGCILTSHDGIYEGTLIAQGQQSKDRGNVPNTGEEPTYLASSVKSGLSRPHYSTAIAAVALNPIIEP